MRKLTRLLIFVSLFLITNASVAMPPVKWNQRYQDYINKYRDVAIYEMLNHDIPASITMAQGLLESGAGTSDLTVKGNNHFGIKCHDWTGPTMHHDDDARGECFRVYDSPLDSYEDHSKFLKRTRYQKLFRLRRTDYVGWARGLKECGYATNPKYAQLLIDIIRCYKLDELDRAKSYNAENINRLSKGRYYAGINNGGIQPGAIVKQYAHEVKMNNKNYYVVARRGDTFKSIAKEFDVSYRKIAKYNERHKNDALYEGEIVYLEKKRTKADKQYKGMVHVVKQGESMYTIAQKYGVRLKSLYKKNHFTADQEIYVNDRIRIY